MAMAMRAGRWGDDADGNVPSGRYVSTRSSTDVSFGPDIFGYEPIIWV